MTRSHPLFSILKRHPKTIYVEMNANYGRSAASHPGTSLLSLNQPSANSRRASPLIFFFFVNACSTVIFQVAEDFPFIELVIKVVP